MYRGSENKITIYRGDDQIYRIRFVDTAYVPRIGDIFRFVVKSIAYRETVLLEKSTDDFTISDNTLRLHIKHEDTENLENGMYKYDIEIRVGGVDGLVTTVVQGADFELIPDIATPSSGGI